MVPHAPYCSPGVQYVSGGLAAAALRSTFTIRLLELGTGVHVLYIFYLQYIVLTIMLHVLPLQHHGYKQWPQW